LPPNRSLVTGFLRLKCEVWRAMAQAARSWLASLHEDPYSVQFGIPYLKFRNALKFESFFRAAKRHEWKALRRFLADALIPLRSRRLQSQPYVPWFGAKQQSSSIKNKIMIFNNRFLRISRLFSKNESRLIKSPVYPRVCVCVCLCVCLSVCVFVCVCVPQ
jgi:hypothetical protein